MDRSKFELGLSNDEALEIADTLDALTKHDGWPLLVQLVIAAQIQAREAGFSQGPEQFQWWKGYVEGIGLMLSVPAEVRAQAKRAAKVEVRKGAMNPLRGGTDDGDLT